MLARTRLYSPRFSLPETAVLVHKNGVQLTILVGYRVLIV